MVIKALSWDSLKKAMKQHCIANDYPIGLDFDRQLESWVCQQMPDECEQVYEGKPIRPPRLGMRAVLAGSRVMLNYVLAGRPLVAQAEANSRAAVCAGCPYNVQFSTPCGGLCAELKDIVAKVVGGSPTPYDQQLRSCAICGCYLVASCHVPLEIQCSAVTDGMKAEFAKAKTVSGCWKQC